MNEESAGFGWISTGDPAVEFTLVSAEILAVLCKELLLLARREEALAARESQQVPYWGNYPDSIGAHQAAAAVLRGEAEAIDRLRTRHAA